MRTRGIARLRSRTMWIAALAVAAVWWTTDLRAQLPLQSVGSPFEMTGFLQTATVDNVNDVFSGGTLMMNNQAVIVPENTIFQMPATAITWAELFKFAPAPYGPTSSGLAMNDTPKPATTNEVTVQGTRIGDKYIAALVFMSQLSLHAHQGFISYIDYPAGEIRIGGKPGDPTSGTRVRINDPIGRFSRAWSHDVRFTIDEDNPTIKAETGYPMCLPRTDPAVKDDAQCPQSNRPVNGTSLPTPLVGSGLAPTPVNGTSGLFETAFTMPAPAKDAANNPIPGSVKPDPTVMAPFEIGDYVTVKGEIVPDGASQYISAWGIDANVGIFTTPGTTPVYVSVDVLLMGTGPTDNVTLAQEGAKRFRMEGFTTDPSRAVKVYAVDVDPCTGAETNRPWATQEVDQGPPTGAVRGRWRFRPGAPLFDLKGFPFLPPTREAVAYSTLTGIGAETRTTWTGPTIPVSCSTAVCKPEPVPTVQLANGLVAGQYTLPNFEFILPENLGIGNPKVPANYDTFRFLAQGSGPWNGGGAFGTKLPQGIAGALSPFPGATTPPVAACAATATKPPTANAGPNQTVASGVGVTLDGSASADGNPTALPLNFSWKQISGPAVTLANPTGKKPTFTAPVIAVDGQRQTLEFLLTVDNGTFAATSTVTVTVARPFLPVVTLGPDQVVETGTPVTLDAARSTDRNVPALPLSFSWLQTGTPAVTLTGSSTATPTFVAPGLPAGQTSITLTFSVTVTNGIGTTGSTGTTHVTVKPAATPPVATTSADPSPATTGALVTLNGVASADTNNPQLALTYKWTQPTTQNVTLTGDTLPVATFVAPTAANGGPAPGAAPITFGFTLVVNNGRFDSAPSAVNVTVNSPRVKPSITSATARVLPATTGTNPLTVNLQANTPQPTIGLDAAATDSNTPTLPVTFAWAKTAGPIVTLVNANTANATFTAPVVANGAPAQTLTFQVTATNSAGVSATKIVSVTVTSPRLPATANAGATQTVAVNAPVVLDASGSTDPNSPPQPLTYSWTQPAGQTAVLSSTTIAKPTFTAPATAGPLTFTVAVSNTINPVATATTTVNVKALPIANAGAVQTVAVGSAVTLNGAASSDPNTPPLPLTFAWAQTSGIPVTLSNASASTPTFTAPATAGPLGFALTVNNGVAPATASVNVNVAAAPVANAGAAQTVASASTVTLSALGSTDPNNPPLLPLTYLWSAPAGVTLADATTPAISFVAPTVAPGAPSLPLTFTVTVGNGVASSSAAVVVTVDSPAVVSMTTPSAGTEVGQNVTLTAAVTDNAAGAVVVFLDQFTDAAGMTTTSTVPGTVVGPVGSGPGGSNYTLQANLPVGSHVVTAQVTDAAGNVTTASVAFTVK